MYSTLDTQCSVLGAWSSQNCYILVDTIPSNNTRYIWYLDSFLLGFLFVSLSSSLVRYQICGLFSFSRHDSAFTNHLCSERFCVFFRIAFQSHLFLPSCFMLKCFNHWFIFFSFWFFLSSFSWCKILCHSHTLYRTYPKSIRMRRTHTHTKKLIIIKISNANHNAI